MCTIFTDPEAAAQRFTAQERMDRLESIDPDRMRDALTFLIGFSAPVFDEILDSVEPFEGENDPDLAPFCQACSQPIGLFLKWPGWRHYRGEGEFGLDHIEVLESDHDPVLIWKIARDTPAD